MTAAPSKQEHLTHTQFEEGAAAPPGTHEYAHLRERRMQGRGVGMTTLSPPSKNHSSLLEMDSMDHLPLSHGLFPASSFSESDFSFNLFDEDILTNPPPYAREEDLTALSQFSNMLFTHCPTSLGGSGDAAALSNTSSDYLVTGVSSSSANSHPLQAVAPPQHARPGGGTPSMRGQPNPDQMSGMHGLPVPRNQPSTMPPSGAPTFSSESVPYPTQLPTRTPLPPPPPPHPAPPSTGLQLRPSSNTAKDVARSNFTKECEMYRLILLEWNKFRSMANRDPTISLHAEALFHLLRERRNMILRNEDFKDFLMWDTAVKDSQMNLNEGQLQLSTLAFYHGGVGICSVLDGVVEMGNPHFLSMFEVAESDIEEGRIYVMDLLDPADVPHHLEIVSRMTMGELCPFAGFSVFERMRSCRSLRRFRCLVNYQAFHTAPWADGMSNSRRLVLHLTEDQQDLVDSFLSKVSDFPPP